MAFNNVKDQLTLHMRDDENRVRNRTLDLDPAYSTYGAIGTAFSGCMRSGVDYMYATNKLVEDAFVVGADGDVNDKTNLVFRDDQGELIAFPVYDLEQDCFEAATGDLATVVKDKATLAAAVADTPEFHLNTIIDLVLAGSIKIAQRTITEYVRGYKAD